MLEFAQPLTIKGKDGERWTVDGLTLQDMAKSKRLARVQATNSNEEKFPFV